MNARGDCNWLARALLFGYENWGGFVKKFSGAFWGLLGTGAIDSWIGNELPNIRLRQNLDR